MPEVLEPHWYSQLYLDTKGCALIKVSSQHGSHMAPVECMFCRCTREDLLLEM